MESEILRELRYNNDELRRTNELLQQLVTILSRRPVKLGFQESTRYFYINAVRCSGYLWYEVPPEKEPIPFKQDSFVGYLLRINSPDVSRREKEVKKFHLYMESEDGVVFRFEAGWGSQTAKSIISVIAALTPEQIKQPIKLSPYLGTDKSVVFIDIQVGGEKIFAPYNKQTDWDALYQVALQKLGKPEHTLPGETTAAFDTTESHPDPYPDPVPTETSSVILTGAGVVDRFNAQLRSAKSLPDLINLSIWINQSPEREEIAEVPSTRGWMIAELNRLAAQFNSDVSEISASIMVEMQRLHWSTEQGKAHLQQTYRKRSRQELSGGELLDFLGYLKTQSQLMLT